MAPASLVDIDHPTDFLRTNNKVRRPLRKPSGTRVHGISKASRAYPTPPSQGRSDGYSAAVDNRLQLGGESAQGRSPVQENREKQLPLVTKESINEETVSTQIGGRSAATKRDLSLKNEIVRKSAGPQNTLFLVGTVQRTSSTSLSQTMRGRCLHVEAQRTTGGDMASNARVPKAEITGIYGYLLKKVLRKMLGSVPDSAAVMWHHPAVFKDMMGMGRKAERWDRLDPSLASFAHMAAASLVGCSFCVDLNYFMAHNKGLDEAKAREVPRWRESDAFTPLERKVMEYAEAMSQTPPTVTDEMSAALLEELGAPALVELTARVALANSTARGNVALGIRAQGFAAACGLQPLATRRLTPA